MLTAYRRRDAGLIRMDLPPVDLTAGEEIVVPPDAIWIDLLSPLPAQAAAVERLGVAIPTLEDMEEIEVSNRLYREGGVDYMTVVLPGFSNAQEPVAGPVAFVLSAERLVTVRYHTPRPFDTFAAHAGGNSAGCANPMRVFLGLAEEIVGRLADLLESTGKVLDLSARAVFNGDARQRADRLQTTLEQVGQQGELLGRVRLAILTMERALSFFGALDRDSETRALVKGLMRDLSALSVHANDLSARIGLTVDATLGLINLVQNATVRIVSVVAVLFLPPTLVASIYGMNFRAMPELDTTWGYPVALGLMLLSALGTYLFFKWKHWL